MAIHWYEVESDAYWILDLHGCYYGDKSVNEGKEVEAVFDTGSAFIYLHDDNFNELYETWTKHIKGIQCSSQICFVEGSCSLLAPQLKDLKFRFDGDWIFVLPSSQYLIDGATLDMAGFCVIGIQGGIDDETPYILGNTFLKNFYMIYDFDTKKIGISLHQNSVARIEEQSRNWVVVVVVAIIVVVIGIVGYCFYKKRQ